MRSQSLIIWILGLTILACGPSPLFGQGTPPDPNREALESLLDDLDKAIEDADQRMIAHPRFLDELRQLVARYRAKLREVFLFDDFSDGDYTQNPTWVVDSGRFRVTPLQRLKSRVRVLRPVSTTEEQEELGPLGIILQEVLRPTQREGTPTEPKQAVIHTAARISSDFEVDLSLLSRSTWGAMEVVLLGGTPPTPRYRLVYHAAPSAERPIQIIRQRGSKSYLIEDATKWPDLDDGAIHRLQWIRDTDGTMRVLVDGEEVLRTVELYYRGDFSGIALVNRGGVYEWDAIQVLKAP
jgi:hypothetical protein